jgi:hypothetical protein
MSEKLHDLNEHLTLDNFSNPRTTVLLSILPVQRVKVLIAVTSLQIMRLYYYRPYNTQLVSDKSVSTAVDPPLGYCTLIGLYPLIFSLGFFACQQLALAPSID